MILRSASEFTQVLEIAGRTLRVREDLEEFNGQRERMLPALTQDWEGGAREDFDEGLGFTANVKVDATDQLANAETELAQIWADSVEQHNEDSYQRAINIAAGVLQGEREEHNRVREALEVLDALAFGWFTDQPEDRVPRVGRDVVAPTEGDGYQPSNSFVHHERQGDHWVPYWRSYPDTAVLGG